MEPGDKATVTEELATNTLIKAHPTLAQHKSQLVKTQLLVTDHAQLHNYKLLQYRK